MVEQMVSSNLSKYGLGKCPSIISSSNNQQVSSLKDTTLKDAQNDNKTPKLFEEDSALQKEEAVTQTKIPHPGSSNVNRNLVYARRKSDAELTNSRTSDKNRITSGLEQTEQQLGDKNNASQKANESSAHISVVSSSPAMEHWHARFAQLQNYLKQCDSSSQDVNLQKLRSFSPDECSRHAVELEKRAIKLMFDEGTEIQRVKDLNMLGKFPGNHFLRPLTPVFKSGNLA